MRNFLESVQNFLVREDGPTAVEYAVMLALIIVVCIAAIQALGTNANKTFNCVGGAIGSILFDEKVEIPGEKKGIALTPVQMKRFMGDFKLEGPGITVSIVEEKGTVGDLNFTLQWFDANDLDLSVFCPCGTRICHYDKTCDSCDGIFDIDMNLGLRVNAVNPVEHV